MRWKRNVLNVAAKWKRNEWKSSSAKHVMKLQERRLLTSISKF